MRAPSIRSLISAIGACVAVTTAVSVPLGYGTIVYLERADHFSFEAHLNASQVSRYAYSYGSMWPFHKVRLAELIELPNKHEQIQQRIVTTQEQLVLELGDAPATPTFTRSAPIVLGDAVVGRMEVVASARPLIINSLFVLLFSSLLGAIAYFSIRILPLRVLDRTFSQLQEKAEAMERMRNDQEQERQQMDVLRQQDLLSVADRLDTELKQVAGEVSRAAAETESVSQTMTTAINSMNDQAGEMLDASHQAASNVQAVSHATEELTASFAEISEKMFNASTVARKATEAVRRTNRTVEDLSASAQKVSEIVKTINAIAAQTNLLALNATIEAARAGTAGRSFAIVAHEVKALASQAATATETIAAQIADMQAATGQTIAEISEISQIVAEIDNISRVVATAVEEQQKATKEIARSTQHAAIRTDEITKKIENANRTVTNTSTAAKASLGAANKLRSQAQTLVGSLDQFLQKVRKA